MPLEYVLLLLTVLVGGAAATSYQDCGSQAQILEFEMTNCDLPPCVVERPSTYNVNITFIPGSTSNELETVILASIAGETFPWPGPDGCTLLEGDQCPLEADKQYKYRAVMEVLDEYPAISVLVTWKLRDENDVEHFCGMVPILLV